MSSEHQREQLERLLGPTEPEVDCDTCFKQLDEYVELEVAGLDADGRLPGMHAHFAGCPACREEHEALRELVAASAPRADRAE